jgi:hypothetical protein
MNNWRLIGVRGKEVINQKKYQQVKERIRRNRQIEQWIDESRERYVDGYVQRRYYR